MKSNKEYLDCLNNFDENEFQKYLNSIKKYENIAILGNGGSNAIASHISQDLYKKKFIIYNLL